MLYFGGEGEVGGWIGWVRCGRASSLPVLGVVDGVHPGVEAGHCLARAGRDHGHEGRHQGPAGDEK